MLKIFFAYMLLIISFIISPLRAHEIKAVVFDFGNVVASIDRGKMIQFLTDSLQLSEQELKQALKQWKQVLQNNGDEKQFWSDFIASLGKQMPENWLEAFASFNTFSDIAGTLDIVKDLQKLSYTTAMLSNVTEYQANKIRQAGYYRYFEPVLLSYEMGVDKPDLAAFHILLEELNLPASEVLFIDDQIANVAAAQTVGMDAILFIDIHQIKYALHQRGIPISTHLDEHTSLRGHLLTMVQLDQDIREKWLETRDIKDHEAMQKIDDKHLPQLKTIVSQYGWPGIQMVGEEGAHAMWLLVQHVKDLEFQEKCLQLLEDAVLKQDANACDLAYLKDRVYMGAGKKQIYGTQFAIRDGYLWLCPIEDPEHVNERRAAIGLDTLEEYMQISQEVYGMPWAKEACQANED